MGVVLGDLDPATILVGRDGPADWAPVLLFSLPPAPKFWPKDLKERYTQIFPVAQVTADNAFVAPEMRQSCGYPRTDWRFCINVQEIKRLQSLHSRGILVRARPSGQNDEQHCHHAYAC
jgi:hypothetical protein